VLVRCLCSPRSDSLICTEYPSDPLDFLGGSRGNEQLHFAEMFFSRWIQELSHSPCTQHYYRVNKGLPGSPLLFHERSGSHKQTFPKQNYPTLCGSRMHKSLSVSVLRYRVPRYLHETRSTGHTKNIALIERAYIALGERGLVEGIEKVF